MKYRVILKNFSFGIFRIILVSKEEKKYTIEKQRQRAISEQVFMIFGQCQNHQNWTFKKPYQQDKSWFKNYFYAKMKTILLLYLNQIFIFLLGHLHFFLNFLFALIENLFKKHPIPKLCARRAFHASAIFYQVSLGAFIQNSPFSHYDRQYHQETRVWFTTTFQWKHDKSGLKNHRLCIPL